MFVWFLIVCSIEIPFVKYSEIAKGIILKLLSLWYAGSLPTTLSTSKAPLYFTLPLTSTAK